MNHTRALQNAMKNAADAFDLFEGTGFLAREVTLDRPAPPAILVAFSGGADSTALLHALVHGGYGEIHAMHVHHGIRGEEADRDLQFCRDAASSLGVPFHEARVDAPGEAKKTGETLEEAARRLRYEALERTATAHAIPLIATAHHADDNLETVLFHLLRGSGTKGMLGIPPRRDNIIRPLILCGRADIVGYCEENGLAFVTDSTNSDTGYTRNFIREQIVPLCKQINPDAAGAAGKMTSALRQDAALLDSLAAEYDGEDRIEVLRALHPALQSRVIAKRLRQLTPHVMPESKHIEAVRELILQGQNQDKRSLPGRFEAILRGGRLVFAHDGGRDALETAKGDGTVTVGLPKEDEELIFPFLSGEWLVLVTLSGPKSPVAEKYKKRFQNIYKLFIHHIINFDKINGNLILRSRHPGDTIRHSGMTKSVKRLLCAGAGGNFSRYAPTDAPMTEEEQAAFSALLTDIKARNALPILCDSDGILLLPGCCVRDGAAANSADKALHFMFFHT